GCDHHACRSISDFERKVDPHSTADLQRDALPKASLETGIRCFQLIRARLQIEQLIVAVLITLASSRLVGIEVGRGDTCTGNWSDGRIRDGAPDFRGDILPKRYR